MWITYSKSWIGRIWKDLIFNKEIYQVMKKNVFKIFVLILLMGGVLGTKSLAQVPSEVQAIVDMDIEKGLETLTNLGYEICGVKPMKKTEDWVNTTTKSCITFKFDKKKNTITEVAANPDYSACLQGLEESHKIWEKYSDGQSPNGDSKVNEERKKLTDAGFKASYWIKDSSPGRSSEYWVNESTKKVKLIVWDTESGKWDMTNDSVYSMAKNPSPIKK